MSGLGQVFFEYCSKMQKVKNIIEEIAKTDITILVKGESGAGKGLVAQAIHLNSHRRDKPFVQVNCAALPKSMLEGDLFGVEKGAFSCAPLRRPGKFELAHRGTILLNEIGEIDIPVQSKLLGVLQEGEFSRLGGEDRVQVNTRVITTTREHLEKSMVEGRFREDLFFRINVMSITVPPLRDRKEQILPLAQFLQEHLAARYGRPAPALTPRARQMLQEHHWPGNLRDLVGMVKRIFLQGEEEAIREMEREGENGQRDLILQGEGPWRNQGRSLEIPNLRQVGRAAAEFAEREVIQKTLQETHWNRKEAAKLLRVSYKALLYKIQKYRLELKGLRRVRREAE
ncbi:MAG: sigma 54-interacting transcriptional regulator [Deltaproteobacteria bacterium]|nr:sigma 54-interacting transcriptional regulator [Deltaproteobacteria bacterium]